MHVLCILASFFLPALGLLAKLEHPTAILGETCLLRQLRLGALQPGFVLPGAESTSGESEHHLVRSLAVLPKECHLSCKSLSPDDFLPASLHAA